MSTIHCHKSLSQIMSDSGSTNNKYFAIDQFHETNRDIKEPDEPVVTDIKMYVAYIEYSNYDDKRPESHTYCIHVFTDYITAWKYILKYEYFKNYTELDYVDIVKLQKAYRTMYDKIDELTDDNCSSFVDEWEKTRDKFLSNGTKCYTTQGYKCFVEEVYVS